jgi:hypothetical protein
MDFGYDPDSRKGEATFNVVCKQARALKAFLGRELFDTLLYEIEEDD